MRVEIKITACVCDIIDLKGVFIPLDDVAESIEDFLSSKVIESTDESFCLAHVEVEVMELPLNE